MDKQNKYFYLTIGLSIALVIAIVLIIVFYYFGKHSCDINGKLTVDLTQGQGQNLMKYPLPSAPAMTAQLEISSAADAAALCNGTGKYGGRCLLMIYSNGCGHCKTTKPAFEEGSKKSKVPFYTADISKFRNEFEKFKVTGIPHIILLENGKEVAKYSGDRSAASFIEFANKSTMPSQPYQ
jgi:thiol-disulfide isomerase/thioredoxin